MGAVLVEVCGRCGTPKGEGREWTQNASKSWIHRCDDGVIGEAALVDPADPENIPSLSPRFIEPSTHLRIIKRADVYHVVVECHKCGEQVRGDYHKEEADKIKYNLFNCPKCGEWQEWLMNTIDGDPLPLKQWKPFEWSKVPTSREETRQWLEKAKSMLTTIEIPLDDIAGMQQTVAPGQPVYLQPGSGGLAASNSATPAVCNGAATPATGGGSATAGGLVSPTKLQHFSADAISNAIYDKTCRPPYCVCASCGRDMTVWVWSSMRKGKPQKMPTLMDGMNRIPFEVAYHCSVCTRTELYVRTTSPPEQLHGYGGRYHGPTLRGDWYHHAETVFHTTPNCYLNWRKPDVTLSTTPIKAQSEDQSFVH